MKLQKKIDEVNFIKSKFDNATAAFLVDFRGLDVGEITNFRRKLDGIDGCSMKIVKNTLAKRALKDTHFSSLNDFFKGPTACIWVDDDPVKLSKLLIDSTKEVEKLNFKAAVFEENLIDINGLENLSNMPSKEQLFSQIISLIETPIQDIFRLLQANARDLVNVLNAYEEKLKENN